MNKKVITIGSAVIAGATSRGLTGLIDMPNGVKIGVNLALAFGAGYVAFTTTGNSTKSALIGGSALGVTIAQSFEAIRNVFKIEAIASKINPESKWGQFLQKTTGLSGAQGGLEGYFDELGNYHEDGLGGYIDTEGNFIQDDGLGIYEDDGLGVYEDDGLGVYEDDGLGVYEDDGLGIYEDDGLGIYEDDGLGVYEDDGLGVYNEQEEFAY